MGSRLKDYIILVPPYFKFRLCLTIFSLMSNSVVLCLNVYSGYGLNGILICHIYRSEEVVAVASMNYDPIVSRVAEVLGSGKTIKKRDVE